MCFILDSVKWSQQEYKKSQVMQNKYYIDIQFIRKTYQNHTNTKYTNKSYIDYKDDKKRKYTIK